MKKIILSTVCGLAMTGAAFAQGYVAWSIPTSDVTFQTNASVYSPLFGGGSANGGIGLTATTAGGFYYALLTSPQAVTGVASSDQAVWDGTWTGASANGGGSMMATNSTGLSHGGAVVGAVNGQSGNVQVSWASGATNNVILVGWSANLGTSWGVVSNELANWSTVQSSFVGQNVFFGETPIGFVTPASSSPGNAIFATSSNPISTGNPIFSLNTPLYLLPTTAVPEPGTMALAGLGGLSMLLFRRKK